MIILIFASIIRRMVHQSFIHSIGHGNKSIKEVIKALRHFDIQYLLDVRSKPFSKWNPDFNRPLLKETLKEAGLTYVFVGDSLGGLPSDRSCYDESGKVLYEEIKEKDFFKSGLRRLFKAQENKAKIALMCSETNPAACHRSKLIGAVLMERGIDMQHIIQKERIYLKSQETVLQEVMKGQPIANLFGESTLLTSRKEY